MSKNPSRTRSRNDLLDRRKLIDETLDQSREAKAPRPDYPEPEPEPQKRLM